MGIKRVIATILNIVDGKPADNMNYLQEAFQYRTDIQGGVINTKVVATQRADGTISSYQNGLQTNPIAFAAGVQNFGTAGETTKIALNHDGSGKLASSNIQWDTAGNASFTGTIYATSGLFSGTVYASAGAIGGFTIEANKLKASGLNTSLVFESLNPGAGDGWVRINENTSGALISLRTDSTRRGIEIQTYAQDAEALTIIANAGSKYAIQSTGGHYFYQRSGEIWSAPGILAAMQLVFRNNILQVVSKWNVSNIPMTFKAINAYYYEFIHNLGHLEYTFIPVTSTDMYIENSFGVVNELNSCKFQLRRISEGDSFAVLLIGRNKSSYL